MTSPNNGNNMLVIEIEKFYKIMNELGYVK